jgi:hypothetical protein
MNCQQSHELFPDFLGKEISEEQSKELARHLQSCADCREDLRSLSKVESILHIGWPDEEPPRLSWRHFLNAFSLRYWPKGAVICAVGTLCFILCTSTLALLKTQIELKEGQLKISFNQPSQSLSPILREKSGMSALPTNLSRSDLEKLMEDIMAQSEQRQNSKMEQLLFEAKKEINAKRTEDLQKISQGMKYLEMTQGEVWKAAARNASYLETLAREVYVKATSTN